MDKRGQFTFYRSFYEAVKEQEPQIQRNVLMAVLEYVFENQLPQGLGATEKSVFVLMKPVLDAARKRASARIKKEKENKKESKCELERELEVDKDTEKDSYLSACVFDSFWKKYPVKIDKRGCRELFLGLEEPVEVVLKGLDSWLGSKQWAVEGSRYVPRPAKWLREKHYLQNPEQVVPMGATGELGKAEIEAIERMMRGEVE